MSKDHDSHIKEDIFKYKLDFFYQKLKIFADADKQNGNRIDIILGLIFILIFTIAGQKEILSIVNYIGVGLNVGGILILIHILINLQCQCSKEVADMVNVIQHSIYSADFSSLTDNALSEKADFDKTIQQIEIETKNYKRAIRGNAIIFVVALILVLIP